MAPMSPASAALLCLGLALGITNTHAKVASQWVNDARATAGSFDSSQRYVINVNADCTTAINKGGDAAQPHTGPIILKSGDGVVIDLCNHSGSMTNAYIMGEDLFLNSAFRKGVSTEGYVKADVFAGAEAKPGYCVSLYFVPVNPGFYPLTNKNCVVNGVEQTLASVSVTGVASDTLEQETLAQYKQPSERDASVVDAKSGDWPGWTTVTDIEISLVATPGCNRPAARRMAMRRLMQTTDADFKEGDASELAALDSLDLQWVYSKGHTGLDTSLVFATAAAPGGVEGGVESGAGRRLQQAAVPAGTAIEGASGLPEGDAGSTEGAAIEGASGLPEGDAGSTEGALIEGESGLVEGDAASVEGGASGPVSPTEGADLIVEGQGGAAEGVVQEDGVTEGDDGLAEGAAEGAGTPSATEGADGITEGNGEGAVITTQEFVSAADYPIEMVVNMAYRLTFNVLRSGGSDFYFSAPEFFADAVVRQVESSFAEFKFATYPTEIERSTGAWTMYVVPTQKGDYTIKSGNLLESTLPFGRMKVIDGTPTDGAKFKKVVISNGSCPPGTINNGASSSTSSLLVTAAAVLVTVFLAL